MFEKDKREWPRIEKRVQVNAAVIDPSNEKASFKLDPIWSKDVGGNGLGLLTSIHCMVGSAMALEFLLPNTKEPIRAKGRVVWSKLEDGSNKQYRVGVAFESISDSDREAIIRYVTAEAGKSSKKDNR